MTVANASGTSRGAPEGGALLELVDIHKRFGGVHALNGATLAISGPGAVHGLSGENGSGKSTLLGILSGQLRPDQGRIMLDGQDVVFGRTTAALAHGIAMVSQETALAPHLSIAENIFLGGRMARTRTGIDWSETRRRASEVLSRLELDYDPGKPVERLRPDEKQMVEIARALSQDTRVLILDEPTSSLTDDEVEALFVAVRKLQSHRVCVIFVSHRINEIFALVDEMTVLRGGRTVAAGPVGEFDPESLVEAMVGQEAPRAGRPGSGRVTRSVDTSSSSSSGLSVHDLSAAGVLEDISLDVAPGEIVGLAGLVGAGRSELLEAIFGVRSISRGTITVGGEAFSKRDARAAIASGIGYLPPDRKVQGLMLRRTVEENLTIVKNSRAGRLRPPNAKANARLVEEISSAMGIRAASRSVSVDTLSGGNQQKVALGKWLVAKPKVLLLDEPTRGVDVSAKLEIQQLLRAAAIDGMGLLVSSSENPELLDLCDRILVMFRGRIVTSLSSEMATEQAIARNAGGHL